MRRSGALVLLAAAAAAAWMYRADLIRHLPAAILPSSPHGRYALAIATRGLDDTELGRAWLDAAALAVEEPPSTRVPFTAAGEFTDVEPSAASWRFPSRRGQRIAIDAVFETGREWQHADLFLDLFAAGDIDDPVASAPPGSRQLTYEVPRDGELVLRAQPSLLARGKYTVHQAAEASLTFPLQDVPARAVRGVFGDARDGGRRRHEGIDIFAPRGTPAVAAADGWITGAATNRLGGNVVWLWSPSQRVALYYAHLDRQAVSRGQRVRAGEVVGYVGTTGNARGTAPHLHFGVYAGQDGAVDPLPFVCDAPCPASRAAASTRR